MPPMVSKYRDEHPLEPPGTEHYAFKEGQYIADRFGTKLKNDKLRDTKNRFISEEELR